ncbi:MAG: ABC transporter ATP-binding protein [Myxococcaceae bacterium]
MSHSALRLEGVTHAFGATRALENVDLEIPSGRCVALIGPNGAGKTTALSLWGGFLRPTRGSASVHGQPATLAQRTLGALIQDAALPNAGSVGEALTLLARLSREPRPEAAARDALARVGLAEAWDRPPRALSHGMAKRAALAQLMFGSPPTLLLDEPTSGLDPRSAAEVRMLLGTLRPNRTLVISSHQLAELEQLCNWVVVLEHGRVVFQGDMDALTAVRAEIRIDVASGEVPLSELRTLPHVKNVELEPSGRLLVRHDAPRAPETVTTQVLKILLNSGVQVRSVALGQGLESGFLSLPPSSVSAAEAAAAAKSFADSPRSPGTSTD